MASDSGVRPLVTNSLSGGESLGKICLAEGHRVMTVAFNWESGEAVTVGCEVQSGGSEFDTDANGWFKRSKERLPVLYGPLS